MDGCGQDVHNTLLAKTHLQVDCKCINMWTVILLLRQKANFDDNFQTHARNSFKPGYVAPFIIFWLSKRKWEFLRKTALNVHIFLLFNEFTFRILTCLITDQAISIKWEKFHFVGTGLLFSTNFFLFQKQITHIFLLFVIHWNLNFKL